MFHDVGWPHARRDTYYAPERIPEEQRQPLARRTPASPPATPGSTRAACRSSGPRRARAATRNGVLTAIEDFMPSAGGPAPGGVPAFFGFGVLWREDAPYAQWLASDPRPLRRQPGHRAARGKPRRPSDRGRSGAAASSTRAQAQARAPGGAAQLDAARSRAFAIAERLSAVRSRGGDPAFSQEQVEEACATRSSRAGASR